MKKKKFIIYLSVTFALSAILMITSRLSPDFSEWYAVTIHPVFVGTIGRVIGWIPFSVAEILPMVILAALVIKIIFIFKTKGNKFFDKSMFYILCLVSTMLLMFTLNAGIHYNRHTFFHNHDINFYRTELNELKVFLTILDEFYNAGISIHLDENGLFKKTGDIRQTAPAAMSNLAREYPRLNLHYPRPKPVMLSIIMSDFFILGFYSPFTIEANYNNIVHDGEKAITALHELAHVAGFMREDEAGFIAFLAARESGDAELQYAAYLDIFDVISCWVTKETYNRLPAEFKQKLDRFMQMAGVDWHYNEFWDEEFITSWDILPEQIKVDLRAQWKFWSDRINDNPVVQVMSDVSSTVNDTFLKLQGQEDGIHSYGRMVDLVMAFYLAEI
jgi:hypothetical protein